LDGLLVLIALAVLAIPVAVVVLLVGQSGLKARVRSLEGRISTLETALDTARRPEAAPADDRPAAERPAAAPAVETPAGVGSPGITSGTPPAPPAPPTAPVPPPLQPTAPPRPVAGRRNHIADFAAWMQANWIYAVSAASLALAGIFLVQYSVQNSLLPPEARVIAAYLLGLALVASGEWLRRRKGDGKGDDDGHSTAYLPSVFAGAGLVTLFAATVAAQQLYQMVGPNPAFALHMATAALAVGLGWFHGPLLVAVGLVGAAAVPFLVSTGSGATPLLYPYYTLIAAAGLAVDAVRRWAWVSVLALVLGFGGAGLMLLGGAGQAGWVAVLVALPVLAIILPHLRLIPAHPGPTTLEAVLKNGKSGWPEFPVQLVAGSVTAASLLLLALQSDDAMVGLMVLAALTLLALALLLWAERAEGLGDLAVLPAAALVLRLWSEAVNGAPLASAFFGQAIALRPPETAPPMTLTWVVALAAAISAAFALRALRGGPLALLHGLGAVLTAPAAVAVLELAWAPAQVLGPWLWALHPMALAAAMVALAARFARRDGADHRRMAHATLSALSLIALSLFILTSATALTLALAALVVAAAWLDRRYGLREMGLFIQIAVAVVSYRLLIDPGIGWALDAPLLAVLIAFIGVIGTAVMALRLLADRARVLTSGVLESAAMAISAVLANVLLTRWILQGAAGDAALETNYAVTLNALPWLVMALAQLYRAGLTPVLRRLRYGLASLAGLLAGAGLLVAAVPLNPLFVAYEDAVGAKVVGPMLLDTLALSYGLPGLVLLVAAWRLTLPRPVRLGLILAGTALMALYLGLEIRRFWQGDWLGRPGVTQYELYSYTIALMVIGAALLYQSIARRSPGLRRIALAVIALVIAKVFLIDAAGLTGLTRVFSFLGLGLSLAGLAWLNRWAGQAADGPKAPTD
jgi:uncharacterized membrane protein